MIVFEHRCFDDKIARNGGFGVTDEVLATFEGEENRRSAYVSCPVGCVVWISRK